MNRFPFSLPSTVSLCFLTISVVLLGAQASAEEPLLCNKGKLVFEELFSSESVDSKWKAAKGDWKIVNGGLQGVELKADNHAASIRTAFEFTDPTVVCFDFKFDGGKTIHCSFNGKGHICRATITPSGFTLRGEKVKKDPKDKTVTVGQVQQKFESGKWYTMQIEMAGKEFVARVDNGPVAFGSSEKVARPKNNFGFPMAGVSSSIDNVKIWNATLNPKWSDVKSKLPANKIVAPKPPSNKQRFARFDKDSSGGVSLAEFIGKRPKEKHEAIKKQFGRRDKDSDGQLTFEELFPVRKKK